MAATRFLESTSKSPLLQTLQGNYSPTLFGGSYKAQLQQASDMQDIQGDTGDNQGFFASTPSQQLKMPELTHLKPHEMASRLIKNTKLLTRLPQEELEKILEFAQGQSNGLTSQGKAFSDLVQLIIENFPQLAKPALSFTNNSM